ncbi:hypothetical protein [Streptomyces sp. NPDC058653]|uniref:hypothetical protein n=1 Tax=Streptomyces sp. NPDC058653 TaxID=3346576 RepID=UPI0036489867
MTTGPGNATTARAKGAARRTRDTAPATWGPSAHLVSLQPLSTEASGAVLRDAAPTAGTAEEAAALGERLGGPALALDTAGRYLTHPTSRYRTFAAYQDALDTEFGDLVGAEHPQAADPDIARTVVRHTFDFLLAQLHDDGYTLARPALFLLALLEPTPVPRLLFTPGRQATAAELDAALAALHQYGLINTPATMLVGGGDALTVGQVEVHPLVHDVIALTPPPAPPATPPSTPTSPRPSRTPHVSRSAAVPKAAASSR